MKREVKYIIENKKFKTTWEDFASYLELIMPVVICLYGLQFAMKGNRIQDYVIGSILIVGSIILTRFALYRKRKLNGFEEIKTQLTQVDNFYAARETLRSLKCVEIDTDRHNFTINAKYEASVFNPVAEWLTIVCVDNCILVNTRPVPVTILFWIKRRAWSAFTKAFNSASH